MPLALPTPTVSRKRHESAMSSAMNRVRAVAHATALTPPGTRESQEGRVLCPFDFTEHIRCASRGSYAAGEVEVSAKTLQAEALLLI